MFLARRPEIAIFADPRQQPAFGSTRYKPLQRARKGFPLGCEGSVLESSRLPSPAQTARRNYKQALIVPATKPPSRHVVRANILQNRPRQAPLEVTQPGHISSRLGEHGRDSARPPARDRPGCRSLTSRSNSEGSGVWTVVRLEGTCHNAHSFPFFFNHVRRLRNMVIRLPSQAPRSSRSDTRRHDRQPGAATPVSWAPLGSACRRTSR